MVSYSSAYCNKRADQVAAEAKAAKLEHERERALQSEAVWRAMAERAQKLKARRLAKPDVGSD